MQPPYQAEEKRWCQSELHISIAGIGVCLQGVPKILHKNIIMTRIRKSNFFGHGRVAERYVINPMHSYPRAQASRVM